MRDLALGTKVFNLCHRCLEYPRILCLNNRAVWPKPTKASYGKVYRKLTEALAGSWKVKPSTALAPLAS